MQHVVAPRAHIARDHVAHRIVGRGDLELRDRLEQDRLGLVDRRLETHRAGDLECHLRGVHGVVRAVVERDAHVLHRIPRDVPLLHGFAHALLDRGDEVARDHPADDLVDELEAFAARQRLDLEPAIAELAAAAGLLLVLAL